MGARGLADSYGGYRTQLVNELQAKGIRDLAVLKAVAHVPRHLFVPESVRHRAYQDTALPIGAGQTISQPWVQARSLELARLTGRERVLEVGTGSGYQAAVLSEMVREVFTIEIIEPLAKQAALDLKRLGYTNVVVRAGDGYQGWREAAPFDAVIVTCSPDHVPQPLIDQLKPGGRMIIPVGPAGDQELIVLLKQGDKVERRAVLPVRFVPMTGKVNDGAKP